ncbi:MAG: flagellar biosynthetic protein FliR [Candidatus Eisenbacteria bacterium]
MPGYDQVSSFLLVLVRCLTFFSLGPVFSSRRVPTQVKLLLSLVTAFALFPLVPRDHWVLPPTLVGFALVLGREVLMGALLSVVAGAIFHGIRMAGDLIGIPMGLSIACIVDPQSGETSMIGMVEEMLAVFLFVLLDGHHLFLRALAVSLDRVPPGECWGARRWPGW